MRDHIVIKGARENNLKDVDVAIPRNALVVFSGVNQVRKRGYEREARGAKSC